VRRRDAARGHYLASCDIYLSAEDFLWAVEEELDRLGERLLVDAAGSSSRGHLRELAQAIEALREQRRMARKEVGG
jgi:hypothetical protein